MRSKLSGVIVLDKPAGMSSALVVAKVKKLLGAEKAGHAGTLDPFATGVLICCINQATRLARFFLTGDKHYQAVLHLGLETDTQDATGCITGRNAVPELTENRLQQIFKQFTGPQMQQPPVYAALKHEGTPLYRLARQGRPVQKPARPVTIKALRITEIRLPEVRFEVSCSAGTYIRTLCADMGKAVGCGGHLASLRRTASGGFSLQDAVSLEALQAGPADERPDRLIRMSAAMGAMPTLRADDALLQRVAHGQRLTRAEVPAAAIEKGGSGRLQDYLKVLDGQDHLKAVLELAPDGGGYNYCCVFH